MFARLRLIATLSLVLLMSAAVLAETGEDWPRFRGLEQTGAAAGGGLDRDVFGLAVAWKRSLGSGYSSVLVAGDQGVTMFTDGEHDYLTAFDPATGDERWRYRVAEMYAGHTGSDDGPISTPAVHDGTVYGLGPRGQLFAVRLADGKEVWSRALDGETDSKTPQYGFATAPLVAGSNVVVQTGGPDGHSITAFDLKTGEPTWSVEDDEVTYQSPAILEIGGGQQIVAINNKYLLGVEPGSGEVLWRHEHGTESTEGFAQPQEIGEDRVLINSLREGVTFQVTPGDPWKVEELWRSNALQASYAIPVYHDGYLYGFSRRFLTCVDAETGEAKWKSRPPGGRGLILVDEQLVVLGNQGEVVVAAASPEGYLERARLPVLDRGYMTAPSYADGHIYVRNLKEMASVRVTDKPTAEMTVEKKKERELLGDFGEFVRRVEAAGDQDKPALVEGYLEGKDFPILEGDELVHFVYQGEVEDIALSGNFLPWQEEVELDRITGTDVYFTSRRLDPEAIWEYRFSVNFGGAAPDPKNPHQVVTLGPASMLKMPRSEAPLEVEEAPEGKRGRMDSFQFRSDVRENERRVQVYVPPGYERSGDTRYPLLAVLEPFGSGALDSGHMDRWLDRLIDDGEIAPVIAVFLTQAGGQEYSGEPAEDWIRMLSEELLPHLEKHYRVDAESRTALGVLDGVPAALHAAFKVPGTFTRIVGQTVVLFPPLSEKLPEIVRGSQAEGVELLVEDRRHDLEIPGMGFAEPLDSLTAALEEKGHIVKRREVPGSWGWGSWRAQWSEILPELYPPPPEDPTSDDGH